MEVEFIQGQGIEQYLESLINDVEFVWLDFLEDGLVSNCINKAHTLVFSLKATPSFFKEYDIDDKEYNNHLYIDVNEFAKILKRANKGELIRLSCSNNMLNIEFLESNRSIKHTLASDDDGEKLPVPDLGDYEFKFTYPLKDMQDIVKDLEVIKSNSIQFKFDSVALNILNEDDSVWNKYEKVIETDYQTNESFRLAFNLDLFSKTIKFSKISNEIMFELKEEMPIKIGYDGGDIELKCILASLIMEYDE